MGFRNPLRVPKRLSELIQDVITGALIRTAIAGARLEFGPGSVGGAFPTREMRFFTGSDVETAFGFLRMVVSNQPGTDDDAFALEMSPPRRSDDTTSPSLGVTGKPTAGSWGGSQSWVCRGGLDVDIIDAVMREGGVGTGGFRSSVDGRADARIDASRRVGAGDFTCDSNSRVSVTHGLGVTPIYADFIRAGGTNAGVQAGVFSRSSTTVVFKIRDRLGADIPGVALGECLWQVER